MIRHAFPVDARSHSAGLVRLAQWWTQASKEARFELVRRTINGDRSAPTFKTLSLAIYLAEVEAGEVGQG